MSRILIFVGMTVFGTLGWWLGDRFGFAAAFVLSGIGTLLGVYVGWRINRDYFG